MSNRQFSLTIKACEILDEVPKRSRSKFVSDAIAQYAKKPKVMDEYKLHSAGYTPASKIALVKENSSKKADEITKSQISTDETKVTKKVKVDSGY